MMQNFVRIRVDTPFGSEKSSTAAPRPLRPHARLATGAGLRVPAGAAIDSETAHRPFRHDGDPSDTGHRSAGAGVDLPFVVDERSLRLRRACRRASSIEGGQTNDQAQPRARACSSPPASRFSRSTEVPRLVVKTSAASSTCNRADTRGRMQLL